MTQPEFPRLPEAAPAGAPLEYAAPGVGRRPGPPVWRQMLEAFGFLAAGTAFIVAVVVMLDEISVDGGTAEAGVTIAGVVASAAVLFATHRRRAWRGLLFVLLLLVGLALLAVGLCFAAFSLM